MIQHKKQKIFYQKNIYIIERLEEKDAERMKNWCSAIPVVSFNGSKYDINLMKDIFTSVIK